MRRYLHRISRPLLDRIDLHAEARQIQYEELKNPAGQEETTEQIRVRVLQAHKIQKKRYAGSRFRFNSQLPSSALEQYCRLGREEEAQMQKVYTGKRMTARAYHRMIKVARTIADLEGSEEIGMEHLSEAVFYRPSEFLM